MSRRVDSPGTDLVFARMRKRALLARGRGEGVRKRRGDREVQNNRRTDRQTETDL